MATEDFISRRVDDFLKLVGVVGKDVKTVLLTASIIINIYLINLYISTIKTMSSQIVEEVRRSAPMMIKEETSKQLSPYKDKIDTVVSKITNDLQPTEN